jgi:predicted metal-dependent phosphoesterase TrpH
LDNLFKADLHCHSVHSGPVKHLKFLRAKDCYSKPLDVYRRAKSCSMDLVTITDHDSIDGCLELLDRWGEIPPDFVMGEEVSAALPRFQHTIHIAVYGHSEAQHREIQRLRQNGAELVAYLRTSGLLFVLNHFFHDFKDTARLHEFIEQMAEWFDVFEVRNGTMQREHNKFIVDLLEQRRSRRRPISMVSGSDSHTLRRIGRSFTASPARNREGFLTDVRAGRTQVFGPHSNHLTLAADIYGVVLRYYPMVLSVSNGEFSPLVRIQKLLLSIAAAPFLFTPYVAAVGHSAVERSRIQQFSRLYFGGQAP